MAGVETTVLQQACPGENRQGEGNPNMLLLPPGLEPPGFMEQMQAPPDIGSFTVDVKDIRNTVHQHAQTRLEEKAELLWDTAYSESQCLDSQEEKKTSQLEEEVRRCHEKLAILEAEKAAFQQSFAMMKEQFDAMKLGMLAGPWPMMLGIPNGALSPSGSMSPLQRAQGYPPPCARPVPSVPELPVASDSSTDMVNPSAVAIAMAAVHAATAAATCKMTGGDVEEMLLPPAAVRPTEGTALFTAAPPPQQPSPPPPATRPVAETIPEAPGSPQPSKSTEISLAEAIDAEKKTKVEEWAMQSPQPVLRRAEEDTEYETLAAAFQSPGPSTPSSRLKKGPRLMGTPSRPKSPQMLCSPKPPTPMRTPNARTAGMLTPSKTSSICPSPYTLFENGSSIFTFTLRRADGVVLGLDVQHNDPGNHLDVLGILPNGAIEAWNRQCSGGPAAGKAVMKGDKIVRVNDATDALGMLEQCKVKQILKIAVVRGDPECEVNNEWVEQHLSSQRRPSVTEAKHGSRDGPLTGAAASVFCQLPPQCQSPFSFWEGAVDFVPPTTPPPNPKPMHV